MKNNNQNEVRPLSTYNPEYLKYKDAMKIWQKNNRKKYRAVLKRGSRKYYAKFPLSVKERAFALTLKNVLRAYLNGKKSKKGTYIKIKNKTGLDVQGLINHFGLENVINWVNHGKDYHIDHIISLSRLEKASMMERASHYTNLRITKREVNQQWGNLISSKVSKKTLDAFVKLTVAVKLGDN